MLKIRSYESKDYDDVWNLHRVALEGTGTFIRHGKWDDDLHDIGVVYLKVGVFLVGVLGKKIIAMGALKPMGGNKAEVKRMRVLPEFQGKGFGGMILLALEKEALKKGYKVLCLDTTIHQVAAQKLYLKNGYIEISRTKEGFPFETIFYEKKL